MTSFLYVKYRFTGKRHFENKKTKKCTTKFSTPR
nr:MAG TPA: hypothetical protein [Caudoviricetes sp.]DAZ37988.1 MAG TPA: hypothetical protein [Caudoviricetes sp.]